jgi:hypothetical protein
VQDEEHREIGPVVPQSEDREEHLVRDHRHQHDVLVVRLQERVERVPATVQDEVPLVEVEPDPAREVHEQHERRRGADDEGDGRRARVAQHVGGHGRGV